MNLLGDIGRIESTGYQTMVPCLSVTKLFDQFELDVLCRHTFDKLTLHLQNNTPPVHVLFNVRTPPQFPLQYFIDVKLLEFTAAFGDVLHAHLTISFLLVEVQLVLGRIHLGAIIYKGTQQVVTHILLLRGRLVAIDQ